ncbi:hypothetical protein CR513_49648, partial [Mucuna pruriens]
MKRYIRVHRKILAEAEKDNPPNWSKFGSENIPTNVFDSSTSKVTAFVSKFIAMGLSRDAVPIAVENYGDNPTKVCYNTVTHYRHDVSVGKRQYLFPHL